MTGSRNPFGELVANCAHRFRVAFANPAFEQIQLDKASMAVHAMHRVRMLRDSRERLEIYAGTSKEQLLKNCGNLRFLD